MAKIIPPVSVKVTDSQGLIDRRWLNVITSLTAAQPPAGSGFVTDGSTTTYAPMTLYQGADSDKTGLPVTGDLYYALDTGATYYAAGGGWQQFSAALTGDVSKPSNSSVTSLATVFLTPGTYGAANLTPTLTIDAKGRVTDLTFQSIVATPAPPAGTNGSIQFNNSGAIGGTSLIFYNAITGVISYANDTVRAANLTSVLPNQAGNANKILVTDGVTATWAANTAADSTVPYYIPVSEIYINNINRQSLFSIAITIDGDLEVDGILVEV
jgi:hypothetical protein